jgi:squalene-hopene/tetraprenyl-beta-curcumene cyclase
MLLALYGKMKKAGVKPSILYEKEIDQTYGWLKSNQNGDGGFPAFDRDKNDNQYRIIKLIFQLSRIDRSAEMFDPSCPDIVGHILEGMG